MSLPTFGGPPQRPPTDQPLPQDELGRLARAVMERAAGGKVTADLLAAVAGELDAPLAHLYIAAGFLPMLGFARESETVFLVCSGGCQQYGAVPVIETLLSLRDERTAAGKPGFDVHTRGCLDRCQQGAMVAVFTGDGAAGIPMATPESIAQAVADALG